MPVHVAFDATRPASHLVRVTQRFPATDDASRVFRMAAWVPGSYKIRDFGRHVQDLTAEVDGKPGRVEQTGKDAWTVSGTADHEVVLTFDVYCRELSVRASHVTADHAHLFPATLALYDAASRQEPHDVELSLPDGWVAFSGLETKALRGAFAQAEDYDHLIDCPVEAGPKDAVHVETFQVRRKPHRFVVWRPPEGVDWKRIAHDVKAVCEEAAKLFGGLPYEHYTFISHVAKDHGGGLEHRNSTVLGIDALALLTEGDIQTKLLPLVAHEFFHTWNVKRILPAAFHPYDYQQEVYTDLLWLFEGFTTYYELPLLARAGVVTQEHWGTVVADMVKFHDMAVGRKRRSVAEASRLTWSLLYQPHEHNVNRNVSYYTKGLFVGLCLDHHLRTHGVKDGLDVVMRRLWEEHGKTGLGVAEDALPGIVKDATGVDVARQLGRWVNGTQDLPIERALRDLGWDLKREHKDPDTKLGLGVHFKGDEPVIERIPEPAPAGLVLQPEDKLVAVEDYAWSGERLAAIAKTRKEGDTVRLHVFREGRLNAFDVPLFEKPADAFKVTPRKGDAAATRRRRAWLGDAWKKA